MRCLLNNLLMIHPELSKIINNLPVIHPELSKIINNLPVIYPELHIKDQDYQQSTSILPKTRRQEKSIAGEESLGHCHNIHGGILWDAELQQGFNRRWNLRSKLSIFRWWLVGRAEWQQRRSLVPRFLSWWQKVLSPEVNNIQSAIPGPLALIITTIRR